MNKTTAITCVFNFGKDLSNLSDFVEFKESIEKQNVPLYVIEITAEGVVPTLRSLCDKDKYIAGKTFMPVLIKGNALNVLSSHVSKEYENIAWLNHNTVIKNENWAEESEHLLNDCKLVKIGKDSCHESPMVVKRDFFETVGMFDYDFCGNSNLITFLSAKDGDLLFENKDLLELYQESNPEIFYKILSYRSECYNYFNGKISYLESSIENMFDSFYPVEESIDLLKDIGMYHIHYSGLHKLIAIKNTHELNYPTRLLNFLKKV